jgi:hypothetical protein
MATVSAASVIGAVVLANRRGGLALAVATALALVVMSRSLPVEVPYEIWNCWAAVFPFTLLLFVAWSVACGDHRLLPLLALTASFVIQAHLSYLLPVLMALAVAIVGLVSRRGKLHDLRRWTIAAVAVAAVCWSAPIVEQVDNRPGNMVLAVRLATDDHETAGVATGLRTAARTIGIAPWWAKRARTQAERASEPTTVPAVSAGSALLVVAGLLALLVLARRRRRPDLLAAVALALALCLSVAVVAAAIPAGLLGFTAFQYALVWTSPAGMWVWLALLWSGWTLLVPARRAPEVRTGLAVAGLAAVAATAALVAAGRDYGAPQQPPGLKEYRLVSDTADQVGDALAGSGGVLLDVPIRVRHSLTFQSAVAYELRSRGYAVSVPDRLVKELGSAYRPGLTHEHVVIIRDPDAPVPAGSAEIVRNSAIAIFARPDPR